MVSKKTPRPPKSVAPAQPPGEKKKKPALAAAKPERRVVTRRKRPATGTAPAEDLVQPATVVSDEEIRVHAYFLSLRYLGSDRNDVDFWLLAERELRATKTPGKP